MFDLESAIRAAGHAVDLMPDDHPDLAACWHSLGNELQSRMSE